MGRPAEVDAHVLVTELQAAARNRNDRCPVLTVSDLAEAVDVSDQSVRNQLDDLEQKPGVRSRKVGQAQVYWYSQAAQSDSTSLDVQAVIEDARQELWEEIVKNRAVYLDRRRQLLSEYEDGDVPARKRLAVLEALIDYLENGTALRVHWADLDEDGHDAYDLPEDGLSREAAERYVEEMVLFTDSEHGNVEGLSGLFSIWTTIGLTATDGHGNRSLDNIDESELEILVPSVDALLAAGDVADRFVQRLHAYEGW
ncbi:hypothetical protein [Halorubrum sp. BV1]|uniref:hypothetical protein n=1 Tax=Halorubrum sp. BV1 TaxID=1498500 RepID=UPI0012BAC19E|nr:hypothetical protein [Halorubrum sp. BV1]